MDAAKVRFFPPGIPLLTIALGWLLNSLWPLTDVLYLAAPLRYYLGAGLAIGAVALLGFWAVLLFRKGGQSENPWKPTPQIEQRGPYQVTRNPMYLQMILVCLGVAIATNNWWIVLLTPLAAWALQTLAIKPEEEYLEQKFGQEYLVYKSRVRRWL